jgi:N-acyl-D-amino-acid deacylase
MAATEIGSAPARVGILALAALVALPVCMARPLAAVEPGPSRRPPPAVEPAATEVGFGIEPLDAVMRETMKKFNVPGGALAVAKDGKLVVAKGYGWANLATRQPVTMDSLFCLASVSKALTAVAMLRLVEEGKLALEDRVYGLLGRPQPLDGFQLDPRVKDITVRHLLLHAAGFDPRKGGDYTQMARKIAKQTGQKLPIADELLIRYALSRPLAYAPGTEEHYSNFGFFLAREVIQRVSGQSYERYVRQHVLQPSGIRDMELERLSPSYAANEVRRYGRELKELPGGRGPVGPPAGSWIGSAVDLARFLTALDGSHGKPLLAPALQGQMLAAPPPPLKPRENGGHFGLGWDVVLAGGDGVRYSKNGGVPGIHAYIEHLPGGLDWVVLLNGGQHQPDQPSPLGFCAKRLREAIRRTGHWPQRDLFERHSTSGRPSTTLSAVLRMEGLGSGD